MSAKLSFTYWIGRAGLYSGYLACVDLRGAGLELTDSVKKAFSSCALSTSSTYCGKFSDDAVAIIALERPQLVCDFLRQLSDLLARHSEHLVLKAPLVDDLMVNIKRSSVKVSESTLDGYRDCLINRYVKSFEQTKLKALFVAFESALFFEDDCEYMYLLFQLMRYQVKFEYYKHPECVRISDKIQEYIGDKIEAEQAYTESESNHP